MQLRCLYICLRGIGAQDASPQTRQRFAQNAAAAADVEHAQAGERIEPPFVAAEMPTRGLFDEGESHRVELVQHRHPAAWIPPLGGVRGKMRDLRLVDA